ncbi:uncharacterized protein LOC122376077 [Amphibalanus amphitrite]|uniref:uncharacterized protein LOC122376077 n=1 Tax=Amphibalanus amphitrite TaxID=1232801 RepID=UPI001C92948E|nr:uncharacterized protein LOC122376077 [Amphibalanus amphitrite]
MLGENKPLSMMASPRVTRWAMLLSGYQYKLEYVPGSRQGHCDGLSRLPLPTAAGDLPEPGETLHLVEMMDASPVTAAVVRLATERDATLSRVLQYTRDGWPEDKSGESPELSAYRMKQGVGTGRRRQDNTLATRTLHQHLGTQAHGPAGRRTNPPAPSGPGGPESGRREPGRPTADGLDGGAAASSNAADVAADNSNVAGDAFAADALTADAFTADSHAASATASGMSGTGEAFVSLPSGAAGSWVGGTG